MASLAPAAGPPRASGKTPPPAPSAAYAKRAREMQEEGVGAGAPVGSRYLPPALRFGGRLSISSDRPPNLVTPPPATAISVSVQSPSVDDLAPPAAPPNTAIAQTPSTAGPTGDLAPIAYPSGFRRARAGTLPSNVHLAAQQYATTSTTNPTSTTTTIEESPNTSPMIPVRPTFRHAANSATSVLTNTATSRLRSGSLNVPSAGLSNAFGPSIFSSWLSNPNGFSAVDELRSIAGSGDSQMDEHDVHTLDYLGLDDSPFRSPPPASVSELKNQAQAAIASSLAQPSSRTRASTVSNPYRRRGVSNLLGTTSVDIEETAEPDEQALANEMQHMHLGFNDHAAAQAASNLLPASAMGGYVAKGFKPSVHLGVVSSTRPRAISVGMLDDPMKLAGGRRATVTVAPPGLTRKTSYNDLQVPQQPQVQVQPQSSLLPAAVPYPNPISAGVPASILRQVLPQGVNPTTVPGPVTPPTQRSASGGNRAANVANMTITVTNGQLTAPAQVTSGRSVSPGREGGQGQTPSRSLWIGNLDPAVTGEDLAHVFAPYGAIESFRLLPEKECGFVNFVDVSDAVRAKEDVLNRLGGNIGMPNGQLVRIGFGKVDSAPLTPLAGGALNNVQTPPNTGAMRSTFGGLSGMSTPGVGQDSQLQNSPTRALWIGSIPATTTPATILSVFSPFGPIESARVLTHKNCGFVNFERLDDAIRARKALNGRDVLGSDVGAVRIGYARVPNKSTLGPDGQPVAGDDPSAAVSIPGGNDATLGSVLDGLRTVKGASSIPVDQQVLGGAVENYRSNLLLSLISNGAQARAGAGMDGMDASVTEQQIIMQELSDGSPDAAADIAALAEFRPPTTYYTSIPVVTERASNRQWDSNRLREFRKRIDSGTCYVDEIDKVAGSLMDGEIVELASDWLGNTVVQKLFEKCSYPPRVAMLERLAPHLAMIGIHKNGTWAAQKIIDCANTTEEHIILAQHLRPFCPPLMLDQFGNYVVQCCLKFGPPMSDFIIDAMVDRLWEIAQGRFGARSMRAVLENPLVTLNQQRRVATAIILNAIPLATNPNGVLLLTWLLEASGFHNRFSLLAPRLAPHLSHLCTHKLASNTVLRIINQKTEPEASNQIARALFFSANDQVLTDVLGDQVNGVTLIHKILQSPFVEPEQKRDLVEVTKKVLGELKVTNSQAYRRLLEEVGLPVPAFNGGFERGGNKKGMPTPTSNLHSHNNTPPNASYPTEQPSLAAMMAALQMQSVGLPLNGNVQTPPGMHMAPSPYQQGINGFAAGLNGLQTPQSSVGSNNSDALHKLIPSGRDLGRGGLMQGSVQPPIGTSPAMQAANRTGMGMLGMGNAGITQQQQQQQAQYGLPPSSPLPQYSQQYLYQLYQQQQQQPGVGAFHV